MKKLTEGSITKQILLFMIPIIIGNSLQRVYILVDTMMVGRLISTEALAAVGAASTIAMMFTTIANGFTSGFSIVIAQYYGKNDTANLKKALASTYLMSFLLVLILTLTGQLLVKPLLQWTNVPIELMETATQYLRILIIGLFTTLLYNMMANVLRAFGDSTIPLIFLIISVTINIGFDYLFIAVLDWGVSGAAIATIISQSISGVSCIVFCTFKRRFLGIKKTDFKVPGSIIKQLILQGLSMSLMVSVVSIGSVILQGGINILGSDLLAGYTSARKYLEFLMMPGAAIAMTAATFVSQNYGAENYQRIKNGVKQMIIMGFIWSTITILIVSTLGKMMVTSVTGTNVSDKIIDAGNLYLITNGPFFYALIILVVLRSSLQGMNHKRIPIAASLIEFGVKIIAVLILVPKLGYIGICITEPITWILGGALVLIIYINTIKKLLNPIAQERKADQYILKTQ